MIARDRYQLMPSKDDPRSPLGIVLGSTTPVLRKRLLREAALPEEAEEAAAALSAVWNLLNMEQ
jgi:hypothetical protein